MSDHRPPSPLSLLKSILEHRPPNVFSSSVFLKSKDQNLSVSETTFECHDNLKIAFDRTDGVPVPSYLFHQPLAHCYDLLVNGQFLSSYSYDDSCSMYESFNMFRSVVHVETGSTHASSKKQPLLNSLFAPYTNQAKTIGKPNPYISPHSTSEPDFLITVDLSIILIGESTKKNIDRFDEVLCAYYNKMFTKDHHFTPHQRDIIRNGFLNYPLLTVELKNERHSSCKSDRMLQCALYALRCIGKNPLFTIIGCPTYLLLIDGTHVHLYSLASTNCTASNQYLAFQRITVSLMYDFDFSVGQEGSVLKFAAFFSHLKHSLDLLSTYVRKCISSFVPRPAILLRGPTMYPNLDHLGISSLLPFPMSPCAYFAELKDDSSVAIKFTTSYSFELHQKLAELGLAPRLIQCNELGTVEGEQSGSYKPIRCGNWFIVIMERIMGKSVSECTPKQVQMYTNQLIRLKSFLQESFYVHGDLRPCMFHCTLTSANILLSRDEIKVIDFDWAGSTKSQHPPRYPFSMFHKIYKDMERNFQKTVGTAFLQTVEMNRCSSSHFIEWPPSALPGSPILHEHDAHWIDFMIQLLADKEDYSSGPKSQNYFDNAVVLSSKDEVYLTGKRKSSSLD
ncbi:hypothetical protein RCL1_002187 [Eukaryota sp. TZLM3-RCL]